MPSMEIICRDCRTKPESSGPPGTITRIWCPECKEELTGEPANQMAVDEVRYMEARKHTALYPPPRVMNRGPFSFGWPGQSRLYQAARLRAMGIGLNFEAHHTQEPHQYALLRAIASRYGEAAEAVDPVRKSRG